MTRFFCLRAGPSPPACAPRPAPLNLQGELPLGCGWGAGSPKEGVRHEGRGALPSAGLLTTWQVGDEGWVGGWVGVPACQLPGVGPYT